MLRNFAVRFYVGRLSVAANDMPATSDSQFQIDGKGCSSISALHLRNQSSVTQSNYQKHMEYLKKKLQMSNMVSANDVEEIFRCTKRSYQISAADGELLLSCCGKLMPQASTKQRAVIANRLLSLIFESGNVTIDHCNTLLLIYLENYYPFSPMQFIAELKSRNLDPNEITYQRLIARYSEMGDVNAATSLMGAMCADKFSLNEDVFNSLIAAHARSGNFESVEKLMEIMRAAKLLPGYKTYISIARSCAAVANFDKLDDALVEAAKYGMNSVAVDFVDIAHMLALEGHAVYVYKVLSMIPASQRNIDFFSALENRTVDLITRGKHAAAFDLFFGTSKACDHNMSMMHKCYISFFARLFRANGCLSDIKQFIDVMETERGVTGMISALFQISLNLQNTVDARSLLELAHKLGGEVNGDHLKQLIIYNAQMYNLEEIASLLRWTQENVPSFELSQARKWLSTYSEKLLIQISQLIDETRLNRKEDSQILIQALRRPSLRNLEEVYNYFVSKIDHDHIVDHDARLLDISEAEKIIGEMQNLNSGGIISPCAFFYICSMYTYLKISEKALVYFNQAFEGTTSPGFIWDANRIFDLALLLLEEGSFDDAIMVLQRCQVVSGAGFNSSANNAHYATNAHNANNAQYANNANIVNEKKFLSFLERANEMGGQELLKRVVLNCLPKNGHGQQLLQLCLNSFLEKGLLSAAADIYAAVAHQFCGCSAVLPNLIRALIQKRDKGTLDTVVGSASKILGSGSALLTLAMCYIDCDQISEATQLFQDPVIASNSQQFEWWCRHFYMENKKECLKALLELSSGKLFRRDVLCHNLMLLCIKTNDLQTALEARCAMLLECVSPLPATLQIWKQLLDRNGMKPVNMAAMGGGNVEWHRRACMTELEKIYTIFQTCDNSSTEVGALKQKHEFVKAIEVVASLQQTYNNVWMNPTCLLYLCSMFADVGQLQISLKCYKTAVSVAQFGLDLNKVLDLATLLVQKSRHTEAIQLLQTDKTKFRVSLNSALFHSSLSKLLTAAVSVGENEVVKNIWNVLNLHDDQSVSCLISTCCKSAHIEDSLEMLLNLSEVRQSSKLKPVLFKSLIEADRTDLAIKVANEALETEKPLSLVLLATTFCDCGKLMSAEKLFLEAQFGAKQFNDWLSQFALDCSPKTLENLLRATVHNRACSRDLLYYYLILAYEKANCVEQLNGIWERIQEECVVPSDRTIFALYVALRHFEQPVLFPVTSTVATIPVAPRFSPIVPAGSPVGVLPRLRNETATVSCFTTVPPLPPSAPLISAAVPLMSFEPLLSAIRSKDADSVATVLLQLVRANATLPAKLLEQSTAILLSQNKVVSVVELFRELLVQKRNLTAEFLGTVCTRLCLLQAKPELEELANIFPSRLLQRTPLKACLLQLELDSGNYEAVFNILKISDLNDVAILCVLSALANLDSCAIPVSNLCSGLAIEYCSYLVNELLLAQKSPAIISAVYVAWCAHMLAGRFNMAEELENAFPTRLQEALLENITHFCEAAKQINNEDCLWRCASILSQQGDRQRNRLSVPFSYLIGLKMEQRDLCGSMLVLNEAAKCGFVAKDFSHRVLRRLQLELNNAGLEFNQSLMISEPKVSGGNAAPNNHFLFSGLSSLEGCEAALHSDDCINILPFVKSYISEISSESLQMIIKLFLEHGRIHDVLVVLEDLLNYKSRVCTVSCDLIRTISQKLRENKDLSGLMRFKNCLNDSLEERQAIVVDIVQLHMQNSSYLSAVEILENEAVLSRDISSYEFMLRKLSSYPTCSDRVNDLVTAWATRGRVSCAFAVWCEHMANKRYKCANQLLQKVPVLSQWLAEDIMQFAVEARTRGNWLCLYICLPLLTSVSASRFCFATVFNAISQIKLDQGNVVGALESAKQTVTAYGVRVSDFDSELLKNLTNRASENGFSQSALSFLYDNDAKKDPKSGDVSVSEFTASNLAVPSKEASSLKGGVDIFDSPTILKMVADHLDNLPMSVLTPNELTECIKRLAEMRQLELLLDQESVRFLRLGQECIKQICFTFVAQRNVPALLKLKALLPDSLREFILIEPRIYDLQFATKDYDGILSKLAEDIERAGPRLLTVVRQMADVPTFVEKLHEVLKKCSSPDKTLFAFGTWVEHMVNNRQEYATDLLDMKFGAVIVSNWHSEANMRVKDDEKKTDELWLKKRDVSRPLRESSSGDWFWHFPSIRNILAVKIDELGYYVHSKGNKLCLLKLLDVMASAPCEQRGILFSYLIGLTLSTEGLDAAVDMLHAAIDNGMQRNHLKIEILQKLKHSLFRSSYIVPYFLVGV